MAGQGSNPHTLKVSPDHHLFAPAPSLEQRRRQVYLVVASLGGISQIILIGIHYLQRDAIPWNTLYTTLIAVIILPLVLSRKVTLHQIDLGVLTFASLGLLGQLIQTLLLATTPEPRLYFIGAFLFLIAFNILSFRRAALYSVLLYLFFVALTYTHAGNAISLVELAVMGMLVAYFSVFGKQVSAARAGSVAYQRLSLTDPLTGLENRRAMYQRLEQALDDHHAGCETTALLLDLDHFKQINDQHGHPVGDQVLQRVAAVLTGVLREGDTVARWGGEEFLMLIQSGRPSTGTEVAERALNALRMAPMPLELQITASCGVCRCDEVHSVTEWLNCVDKRLYAAKTQGRDQVRLAHEVAFD